MIRIPRVTVIIPTYNRAAFLIEAVDSVLRQSFSDFEIIISDDGSSDNTARVVSQIDQPPRSYGRNNGWPSAFLRPCS